MFGAFLKKMINKLSGRDSIVGNHNNQVSFWHKIILFLTICSALFFPIFKNCVAAVTMSVTPSTVAPGGTVKAQWMYAGAWVDDRIEIWKDDGRLDWFYSSSCTKTTGSLKTSGSCDYAIPGNFFAGVYSFKYWQWQKNFLAQQAVTVATCANSCPAAGALQCSGNGFQTCSDGNGDGCLEWGLAVACPSGQTCTGAGVCAAVCANECSASGLAQCSGDGYQTCGNYDADSCLEWSSVIACPTGQTCTGAGVCSDDCEEEDYKECHNGDVYWYDSCGNRGEIYDACAANETCAGGACAAPCSNDCSTNGAKQCSGNGYRVCGNHDSDSCLEWSSVFACPSGQTCSGNGVCATSCVNGCSMAGLRQCSGSGYQTCGNHDSDSCLEWSTAIACPSDMVCKSGICVTTVSVQNTQNTQNTTIVQANQTPADTKAPVIPSGALLPIGSVTDATATLSVATDEASTCKYDIVDVDFDSMKNFFDGNGTSHTKSITLNDPKNYIYFVRCKDQAGNKNLASSKIEFAYGPKNDDKTPLSISGLGPMGTIYDGNVMLAAATEVPADCRFDIADADFDSMAEKMESNDGVNQQAVLSLANFGSYNYYVRCRDKSQKLGDGLAQIAFEYVDAQLEQANQQPAVEEESPPASIACGDYTLGVEDGQCLAGSDCVCDPDCFGGEDDSDCANVVVKKKGDANWMGAALGGLGVLGLLIVAFVLISKKRQSSGNPFRITIKDNGGKSAKNKSSVGIFWQYG